jgi:hypothetical protein
MRNSGMLLKPVTEPFNKAEAGLRIPSTQFEKLSIEAEDILVPDASVSDTDLNETAPGDIAKNDWYEP